MTDNLIHPFAKPNSADTVLVVCGPTGIGKTTLSLSLARHRNIEIISADSRQIYRYMDIGTAKPSAREREKIPHHMVDFLAPDAEYSAGQFGSEAREIICDIFSRGNLPVVVGGSGLYIRALLDGFFQDDIRNPMLRDQLSRRLEKEGSLQLHEELTRIDPQAAARIHPNNGHRIVRALEVCYTAQQPISEIQREKRDPAPFTWIKYGLTMERQALYDRINRRVDDMFGQGLLDEVKKIIEMGYSTTLNALNSVGYKEVIAHLNGELDLESCKALIKRNSRRYAKRQLTWFRSEKDLHWLDVADKSAIEQWLAAFSDNKVQKEAR